MRTYVYRRPWTDYRRSRRPFVLTKAAPGSFTLTADATSYTLSGQSAGLIAARLVAGGTGAYTLAGQDAALSGGKTLAGGVGAFSLSGQDAALLAAYVATGGVATFALSGQDATLTYAQPQEFALTADAASYTLGGVAATLSYSGSTLTPTIVFTLPERNLNFTLPKRGP